MLSINDSALSDALDFPSLIKALKMAFQKPIVTPLRHHHNFKNPNEEVPSTLLLMPSWEEGTYLGVKLVVVCPNNASYHLPSIQGQYLLFDAVYGTPLAQMDAKLLTNLRTAAASALAADYLARKDAKNLLMLGTGSLAPFLIQAHKNVRSIQKVWIWGRNYEKAKKCADQLHHLNLEISPVENYTTIIDQADIISTATLANQPILSGKYLKEGQHLDLVGSFKPDMRETDNTAISKSEVYVDTLEGAPKESGDIFQPIQEGILLPEDINGDLFGLCKGVVQGRQHPKAITLFKSVGHALEDLAAAVLAYDRLK